MKNGGLLLSAAWGAMLLQACSPAATPRERLVSDLAAAGLNASISADGTQLQLGKTLAGSGENTTAVAFNAATVAGRAAEVFQRHPAATSAVREIWFRTLVTRHDRLGDTSSAPFVTFVIPGDDWRRAKFENLGLTAALGFARRYHVSDAAAHNGLYGFCAAFTDGDSDMCKVVFAACHAHRKRVNSRVFPSCPSSGSYPET